MKLFTSEQVSAGHPDKICDQISDAIVTECLRQDKRSRVAVETLIKDYNIVVAGELTTEAVFDINKLIQDTLARIGLENVDKYQITNYIGKQSSDIALGVDTGGAGDQGMMFGYATAETPEMMPLPYVLATRSLIKLKELKHPELRPDAKSQVTYDYENKRIHTFLISTQHTDNISNADLHKVVRDVMIDTAREYGLNTDFEVLVNPTGRFVIGSSFGDSGVTGRKIIADTYGGKARHGGGAFSGKDPSKVDRSGAYICRKIAKDIIREELAYEVEIQISYAIGLEYPISVSVDSYGTSTLGDKFIEEYITNNYDLTPRGIIKELDLLNIDYNETSSYGHFGKPNLPWEVEREE